MSIYNFDRLDEIHFCLVLQIKAFLSCHSLASEDYIIVSTPPFAESVTEGDVRWDKGKILTTLARDIQCESLLRMHQSVI